MNEQLIAELAYATLLRTGAPTGSREWQKIFAELIVKECAAEAHRRVCVEGNDNMIYAHLLEHFGVTE